MEQERQTSSDIVFDAVTKIAEDIIHCLQATAREQVEFGKAFTAMGAALDDVKKNLQQHIMKTKWATPLDKEKVRLKMRQINALMATCKAYEKVLDTSVNGLVRETMKMEGRPVLEGFLESLEIEPDPDDL